MSASTVPNLSIVLPAGWQRLPRHDFGTVGSLGGVAPGSHGLVSALTQQAAKLSEDTEISFAAILGLRAEPFVLAASVVMMPLPLEPHTLGSLELQLLAEGGSVARERVSLTCGPALMFTETIEVETMQDDDAAEVLIRQYLVPFQQEGGVAVTFATPLLPLADQFLRVFSAMANTMRLRHG